MNTVWLVIDDTDHAPCYWSFSTRRKALNFVYKLMKQADWIDEIEPMKVDCFSSSRHENGCEWTSWDNEGGEYFHLIEMKVDSKKGMQG